jgi:acid phosphatase family membrane protein YuiD
VSEVFSNPIIVSAFWAWLIAQVLKFTLYTVRERRVNLAYLATMGGMPSTHSATVAATATAAGMREGFGSSAFAIAFILAIVVMYDAAGVRRAAMIQARILNQIIDELFQGHPISETRLRELLGHTPLEVVAGALIGILVAYFRPILIH